MSTYRVNGRIYGEEWIDPDTLRASHRRRRGAGAHRRSLVLGACACVALLCLVVVEVLRR